MTVIRPGEAADLAAVAIIQANSLEAPAWDVADYSHYDLRVAVCDEALTGFLVTRTVAEGEREVLNLAVAPHFRRQGLGRLLMESLLSEASGAVFLEVRKSNLPARNLYKSMGFREVGIRANYYHDPIEAAIVMKFHSC